MKYKIHPACAAFPGMNDAALDALRVAMRAHGYDRNQPILVQAGQIVDGRHRYAVACELGLTPAVVEISASDDPWQLSARYNGESRRHLSRSALAVALAKIADGSAEYQRLRGEARRKQGQRNDLTLDPSRKSGSTADPAKRNRTADEQFAESHGVGASTFRKARTLLRQAPDLAERVAAGEMDVSKAERIHGERTAAAEGRATPGASNRARDREIAARRADKMRTTAVSYIRALTTVLSDDRGELMTECSEHDRAEFLDAANALTKTLKDWMKRQ